MNRHRTTISATLVALALAALAPAGAGANPLLSGYGGPGQGNQAILGSALLNTPRGGSGGGDGGGSGGGSGSQGSIAVEPSKRVAVSPATTRDAPSSPRRRDRSRKPGNAPALGTPRKSSPTTAARTVARESSHPLGLSGTDFLYVLLGGGALILTGLATRRLAGRTPGPRHG